MSKTKDTTDADGCKADDRSIDRYYLSRLDKLSRTVDVYRDLLLSSDARARDVARVFIDTIEGALERTTQATALRMHLLQCIDAASHFSGSPTEGAETLFRIVRAPIATRMTLDEATMCIRVWRAKRGAKRDLSLPSKWKYLAKLVARLNLGSPQADSIESDWKKWRKENTPLSESRAPLSNDDWRQLVEAYEQDALTEALTALDDWRQLVEADERDALTAFRGPTSPGNERGTPGGE